MSTLPLQFATFEVGPLLFGVDVHRVQEIGRPQEISAVPLAPPAVKGLINLRGQIITAIEMRELLKLDPRPADRNPMNVVIRASDETVSFLIDSVGDVLEVEPEQFELVPETISRSVREITEGVFKLEKALMLVLSVENAARAQRRNS